MPTTYAHYRHGKDVLEKVGPEAREAIESFPELFYYGVHGPDLLFYYDALHKNEVNSSGARIHQLPGADFFSGAARVLREKQEAENSRAYYAYLYGFLCHFSLDVCCHGYIQEKIDASGITHSEIEAELDRELLVRDGKDPVRQRLTGHLHPSKENARVISAFFEGIDSARILKSMEDMVKYLNLLVLPGKLKRGIVMGLLMLSGHYESLHGLVINYKKNPECEDSTAKLMELYDKAVFLAAELIDEFPAVVEEKVRLREVYQYNFSSRIPGTQEK